MKREDHLIHLVLAALLGPLAMACGTAGIFSSGGKSELYSFLLADVLCGVIIFLIVSCLRRGYPAVKMGALFVCLFPVLHINKSIERNGNLVREWMKR